MSTQKTDNQTLRMERILDAAPHDVYQAWTDPTQLAQWIDPFPGTDNTQVHDLDARPGGRIRFTMTLPDGTRQTEDGHFGTLEPPHLLEWIQPNDDRDDLFAGHPTKTTIRLDAVGAQTRLTFELTGLPAAMPLDAAQSGFDACFDKLAALLGRHKGDLVITRVFDAPPEAVWKAWTDPERFKQWYGPTGFTVPEAHFDVQVGGAYRHVMRGPDGSEFHGTGTYKEIVLHRRLVFDEAMADADGNALSPAMRIAVILEDLGGRTRMTLRHSGMPEGPPRDGAAHGWSGAFDKMADALKQEA